MDTFELNKIAGAVLATALAVFGLNELSGIIYHAPHPEKPGMLIEVAEAPAAGAEAGGGAAEAAPIGARLASADVAKGTAAAKACLACHSVEKGGPNKVGPNLWDVVERAKASHEGFAYSEAMAAHKAEAWNYDELDKFLTNPKGYVPGTKMAYAGIKNPQNRADVIAYLHSLSDAPKPLPAP